MRIWTQYIIEQWRDRARLGDGSKQKNLAEFMPAALELQETPPNPLARWLAWILITFFTLTLLWAYFGQVDVVASAEGKIIPGNRVKQIQPLTKGFIKSIHVKEGQFVEKGQPLIELDQTGTAADQARMQQELHNASLNLAAAEALQQFLTSSHAKPNSFNSIVLNFGLLKPLDEEVLLHQKKVWEQFQQYQAQIGGLQSVLVRVRSERAASEEVIKKLQQILPMTTKRSQAVQSLYSKGMASETEYLELEKQRIEQVHDLAAQQQKLFQFDAVLNETQQKINGLKADTLSKLLVQISDSRNQIIAINEELIKATDLNNKQILYAPVSGYVQQLAVNTIGGVVTDAQQLMIIVPEEENLEVEVLLHNQDVGFVDVGMSAEIKVHTFPFTKYGLIDATVIQVSDDAIVDEKLGLVYAMHLKMLTNQIRIESKNVKLIPGMAVTAEVKIAQRRVIEYFLSPLLKAKQESIRER